MPAVTGGCDRSSSRKAGKRAAVEPLGWKVSVWTAFIRQIRAEKSSRRFVGRHTNSVVELYARVLWVHFLAAGTCDKSPWTDDLKWFADYGRLDRQQPDLFSAVAAGCYTRVGSGGRACRCSNASTGLAISPGVCVSTVEFERLWRTVSFQPPSVTASRAGYCT